jgi:RimJ/RimL family protein N-acetyltransferase
MTSEMPYVLSMRALEMSDMDAIATWFDELEDLSLFERSSPLPRGRESLRESWKEDLTAGPPPARALWFVACDSAGEAVAIGGLQSINYFSGDCVMPVFVARQMRRRGIAIRLIGLLLDLAFDSLRLTRVTTYYREDNEVSARMLQRAAFKQEGRMRKAWFFNGRHLDTIVAGMLQKEWARRRSVLQEELDGKTVLRFGTCEDGRLTWPASQSSTSSQRLK